MTKVVINRCFGGFGLSHEAIVRYFELKGKQLKVEQEHGYQTYYEVAENGTPFYWNDRSDLDRNDPALVQTVEELGERANGAFAKLKVVEIPDDIKWYIDEYDGMERISEEHRAWS